MNGLRGRLFSELTRNWRLYLICLIAAGFSSGVYLYWSAQGKGPGFPLDDAWIHQTYARNLAVSGEWAYFPGEPSAGSTSPLWTVFLAAGYVIGAAPYLWAYLLGIFALAGIAGLGAQLISRISAPAGTKLSPQIVGLLAVGIALEWHLAWAAGSGMETLLAALVSLVVVFMLLSPSPAWFSVGGITGLGIWIRPDAVALLGPAVMVLLFTGSSWNKKRLHLGQLIAGFGAIFLPYLLFNRLLAGSWWPNTYYAKQAEYAIELQASLISRLQEQALLPLVGVGALLLPGFAFLIVNALRRKSWAVLAGAIWALGYIVLYALRLPVTYQYGRYVMPMMPVYFALGTAGMAAMSAALPNSLWMRVIKRAWMFSSAIVLLVFWFQGAQIYRRDVAFIEEEMVAAANWVAQNTPPDSLVAAHDIGALGYFAQRQLLDLAGLVSPQVISFIRDEARLAAFLDETQAGYLVTFPGWYPTLIQSGELLYQTSGTAAPSMGGENMAVYRWRFFR